MSASATPRTVLFSVHPRFAHAILDGHKTVELRRHRVGVTPGAVVVLYATSPVMAVLGTAHLDSVDIATPATIWQRHGTNTGLTKREYFDYLNGCDVASALILRQPALLPAPIHLKALQATNSFQPPQSYRYIGPSDPAGLRRLSPELAPIMSA